MCEKGGVVENTTWLVCQQYLLGHNNVNTDFSGTMHFAGSQFPDQGLNPGHSSESPES